MSKKLLSSLLNFISASPTAFQAVSNMETELLENGFTKLSESEKWDLQAMGNYFVSRNGSSIIAFTMGEIKDSISFNIIGTHADSPSFKLKERCELVSGKKYTRLNVENYGGMIMSSWLDRPLSIAGRVIVKDENNLLNVKNFNINNDLLLIPSVAIHMDRNVNDGYKFNPQNDMMPLFSEVVKEGSFNAIIAKELGIDSDSIMGKDLYLYNRQAASIWGKKKEFFSAPRIDNLECSYMSHLSLIEATPAEGVINIHACFDNEEVGSATKQGAGSTFLQDVIERISYGIGMDHEDLMRSLSNSFLISADNGHAVHPNHPEHTDSTNSIFMNEGVVVKSQAGGRYISDGLSSAIIKAMAQKCDIPLQYFSNRSDKAGGSTLGCISLSHVSINSVDIGLAMLAMHSAYETAGTKDPAFLQSLLTEYYQNSVSGIIA